MATYNSKDNNVIPIDTPSQVLDSPVYLDNNPKQDSTVASKLQAETGIDKILGTKFEAPNLSIDPVKSQQKVAGFGGLKATTPVTSGSQTSAALIRNAKAATGATRVNLGTPTNNTPPAETPTETPVVSEEGAAPEFTWDKNAADRAEIQYKQDINQAKQDALAKRQEIEQNAAAYQQQSDMQKYLDNQSIEKAGWAGGQVLDVNRQRQYLEASIQAAMYNSMELQRYGYKSQLDAARLAYDANMYDLALEYYNTAYEHAISEAQLTGIWFTPEQRDMLSQSAAANKVLADENASQAEKDRAQNIINTIDAWFEKAGISKEGQQTLAAQSAKYEEAQIIYSIWSATLERIKDQPGQFVMCDANGKPIIEDGFCKTIDLMTATSDEIDAWLSSGDTKASGQIRNFITDMFTSMMTSYNSELGENDTPTAKGLQDVIEGNSQWKAAVNKLMSLENFNITDYITPDSEGNVIWKQRFNSKTFTVKYNIAEKKFWYEASKDGQNNNENNDWEAPADWYGGGTYGIVDRKTMRVWDKATWEDFASCKGNNNYKEGSSRNLDYWFDPAYDEMRNGASKSFAVQGSITGMDAQGYWVVTEEGTYSAKSTGDRLAIYEQLQNAGGSKATAGQLAILEDGNSAFGFYIYVCAGDGIWQRISPTKKGYGTKGGYTNYVGVEMDYLVDGGESFYSLIQGTSYDKEKKSYSNNSASTACFTGDTKVKTDIGWVTMRELYRRQDELWIESFDHSIGAPTLKEISAGSRTKLAWNTVIKLTFSSGYGHASKFTTLKIVEQHALFCLEANKYVHINKDTARSFIGKHFASFEKFNPEGDEPSSKCLVAVKIKRKLCRQYSFWAYGTLNINVETMLSVPSEVEGLYNMFEYNRKNLQHSKELMDIKTFGLMKPEEVPMVPKKIFDAFGARYLKVGIGKGLITLDYLLKYMQDNMQFINIK